MEVINLPIDQITPYWRNPRKNEAAVPQVKASIEKFGFNQPIVLDKSHVIVVGHTRFRAMLQMGATEIPCVVVDLPADKAKQYRIADNKTAEVATWHEDSLIQELRELGASATELQPFFDENIGAILKGLDAPFESISASDIAKADQRLQHKFEESTSKNAAFMITTACPHCGQEIRYDAREIQTMIDIGAEQSKPKEKVQP